ncbi:MAG TPA: hypothetical protein VEB66_01235 [Opitutaceae bacterium]|nr:hypothetical protein [Opitutaceae bacterium]
MRERLEAHWREFTRGTPGRRFRDRYERNHRRSPKRRWLARAVRLVAAAAAAAIAVPLTVLPGPAVLFLLAAAMLLATEWLWVARLLDWLEVRGRRGAALAARAWKRLPSAGRVALAALAVTLTAASTWGLYQLVR